jgi:peptide/nickel transport system permease protein
VNEEEGAVVLVYIGKRLVSSIVPFLAVIVGVFFLARIGGSPASLFLPLSATPEQRRSFDSAYGLNQPILVQLWKYLVNVLHLRFGTSLATGEPAAAMVLRAFPITLELAAVTMLVAIVGAVLVGSWAAFRPNGVMDRVSSALSMTGASMPMFWFALMGIWLFAIELRVLPTSGLGENWQQWVLPVATLVLRPFGVLTQIVRGEMISALRSPYIKLARSKGAGNFRVALHHALRNAAAPALTVAGDLAVGLINGAVVVETIFGWPGIGNLLISSALNRDYPVLQAAVLVIASAIFALNIAIDMCYWLLDPRVRQTRSRRLRRNAYA